MKTITAIIAGAGLAVLVGAATVYAQTSTVERFGTSGGYVVYGPNGPSTFVANPNGSGTLYGPHGNTVVGRIGNGFTISGPATPAETAPAIIGAPAEPSGDGANSEGGSGW